MEHPQRTHAVGLGRGAVDSVLTAPHRHPFSFHRDSSQDNLSMFPPSPAPSSVASGCRPYSQNSMAGPFPTPPASASSIHGWTTTPRPSGPQRAVDSTFGGFADKAPAPSDDSDGLEPGSGPMTPSNSPLRLPNEMWIKIRDWTERRRVENLIAQKKHRKRLERDRRRRDRLERERVYASDTELDIPEENICQPEQDVVHHPKPISQFRRLAFLDLEDAQLLEPIFNDGEDEPVTPPLEPFRPQTRIPHRPAVHTPPSEESVPELESSPTPDLLSLEHVAELNDPSVPFAAVESLDLVLLPHESSESQSVTSMSLSCDYSTGTASSDESRLTSRADRKRILLDRLMHYFHSIFASSSPLVRTHAGSDNGSPSFAASSARGSLSNADTHSVSSRKRPPTEDSDGDDEGDGTGGGGRKRPRQKDAPEDDAEPPMRLACPFFKKNPRKYRLARSCPGPGWATVHRVKEHLYRCHRLPIHCLYCHDVFGSDAALQTHLRAPEPCRAVERPGLEGVDAGMEKALRKRKRAHEGRTEADKWRDAYLILFPGDDPASIPSPFYEYTETPTPDDDSASVAEAVATTEISRYEAYLRRELPAVVRAALASRIEAALHPLEETLRDQIVDIVRDSQASLFHLYRASRTASSDANPDPTPPGFDTISTSTSAYIPPTGGTLLDPHLVFDPATAASGALEDELRLFAPTPTLEYAQFDDFDGELFDFMQLQFERDWHGGGGAGGDEGYGSGSVTTDTTSPLAAEKERAAQEMAPGAFSEAHFI